MAEYIEREAVVRAFCEHCRDYVDKCTYDGTCEVDIIATVPTADVQPVKRGEWLCVGHDDKSYWYRCSVCGYEEHENITKHDNYCPNCGADMRTE